MVPSPLDCKANNICTHIHIHIHTYIHVYMDTQEMFHFLKANSYCFHSKWFDHLWPKIISWCWVLVFIYIQSGWIIFVTLLISWEMRKPPEGCDPILAEKPRNLFSISSSYFPTIHFSPWPIWINQTILIILIPNLGLCLTWPKHIFIIYLFMQISLWIHPPSLGPGGKDQWVVKIVVKIVVNILVKIVVKIVVKILVNIVVKIVVKIDTKWMILVTNCSYVSYHPTNGGGVQQCNASLWLLWRPAIVSTYKMICCL